MISFHSKSTGMRVSFTEGEGEAEINSRALGMVLRRALREAIEGGELRGEIVEENRAGRGDRTVFRFGEIDVTVNTAYRRWNECPDCSWTIHKDTPSSEWERLVVGHLIKAHGMFVDDITDNNEWYAEVTLEGNK